MCQVPTELCSSSGQSHPTDSHPPHFQGEDTEGQESLRAGLTTAVRGRAWFRSWLCDSQTIVRVLTDGAKLNASLRAGRNQCHPQPKATEMEMPETSLAEPPQRKGAPQSSREQEEPFARLEATDRRSSSRRQSLAGQKGCRLSQLSSVNAWTRWNGETRGRWS